MASNEKPPYFKIDKLVSDVTECISSLSQEFNCSNIPIDDSCTVFHRFCSKLEHFLSLGFKERSNLFGKRRNYWDYMLKSLVSNRGGVHEGLKFVKSNLELKTSLGRGRAFLRFCLVHQCLADTLQQCFSCPLELTMEWYADWAPVRDAISLRLLITALYDLNEVQFDLSSPSCHDLDVSWPVFNRKEFGSPFNWKAISRSGSISSLTSSLSAVDNLNNLRAMGAMGSVQEGSEGGGGGGSGDDVGELNSTSGLEEQPPRNDQREQSEDKDIWWMTEQDLTVPGSSQNVMAATQSWADGRDKRDTETEEKLKGLQEELARREAEWERRETEWKIKEEEWKTHVEEWKEKERSWRDEKEILEKEKAVQLDEFRTCEEERRVEIDVLKARVLELEVVKVMAECASIGVQATDEMEVESEKQKRVVAEDMLASVVRENEELKKALEQMNATLTKDGGFTCSTGEVLAHHVECQKTVDSDLKPQKNSRNDDNLRREYESQIQNVRELRGMYEDRMKTAEEQNRKLRDALQDKNRRLELSQKRCSELRAHAEELETLLGEQESVARGLQARLSASVEEGRVLAAQLATVNRLFGRLGDTAELDFERLRLLQNSSEGEAAEEVDGDAQGANGRSDGKEEANDLKEIAVSLPKVWRLLVELLGEEQKEEEAEEANREQDGTDGCFDSVPTPYGPRLVISVSRTFIRLKDLILEKKSLQNELGRIRDLNGRLESKLKQQERRLGTVKVELKRTWSVVSKMRAQHRQLHTSEQVLRYELQRKRKLLGELKEELEYCREKWDLARLKNLQSEKEWQLLRQEFTARRAVDAGLDSTEVNSPESGFSDGRGEDEEEEEVDGAIVESDSLATDNSPKCSEDSEVKEDVSQDQVTVPLQPLEENLPPPLTEEVHVSSDESNVELINSNSPVTTEEYVVVHSEDVSPLNCSDTSTQETSDTPIPQSEIIPPSDCVPTASTSHSSETEKLPESEIAPQPGASGERSMEERLRARAERLRRLEEQCSLLFKKVTRTTTRSTELSNRLEELHEQYGDSRRESPIQADTETGETVLEASACSSVSKSTAIPNENTPPPHPPPTPPPLPNSIPAVRLPSLVEAITSPSVSSVSEPPTPISDEGTSPVVLLDNSVSESHTNIWQEIGQINDSVETTIVHEENRTQSVDPLSVTRLDSTQEPQELRPVTPQDVPVNVNDLVSSNVVPRTDSVIEEQSSGSEVTEEVSLTTQDNHIESLSSMPVVSNPLPVPEETLDISVEGSNEESGAVSGPTETVHSIAPEIFGGIIEEEDEEGVSGGEEDLGEDEMNLDSSEGLMGEDSVEDNTEEREEDMDDEAYIERMSSTIYGLNHGPLFDEGGTSASEDEDREDLPEDDDDDDELDGDGLSGNAATSGSIGVASLLLQQLPMRMDILRRERLSMEQRLEEGEAALERALASSAAAERRSRMLERGLAQAQERVQVLEMEAAVERNKRLLEIKSSLDAVGDNRSEESGSRDVQRDVLQTNSPSLQEEIDSLQRQTLAQIAEFKAAAVVSQAQKEQLNTLSEEVERQEHIVNLLEGELKSLRVERKEQAKSLEDASERLSDALELLSLREEEGRAMQLQLEKLRSELESSSEENKKLSCQLAEAEAQVKRVNSEIELLKDDSTRLQEMVVKLTGEKESLFRANHRLEELRRLVLEDPKWASDKESEVCTACGVTFSIMIRRHHCRSCGKIFCGACSSHWLTLNSGPSTQAPSLVAGVVESLMGSGKRSRACAECFAAYSAECADVQSRSPKASCSRGEASSDSKPGSSKCLDSPVSNDLEGSEEPELLCSTADDENDGKDDDEEEDVEDFSMISEEEVFLSQCTPYVPNPITLQYWKSCEIQSGVISSASDLLAACLADNGVPGKGREEEVWVRAGAIYSVPLLIEVKHIDVVWEFSTNPNSIAFSVLYKPSVDVPMSSALIVVPTTRVNSHLTPTRGRLRPKRAGVYILMFDNSFSRFTGKTISYCLRAEVVCRGPGGRESVTSSSRSSVEPFPDLPVHEEVEGGEGAVGRDESRDEATNNPSSTTAED